MLHFYAELLTWLSFVLGKTKILNLSFFLTYPWHFLDSYMQALIFLNCYFKNFFSYDLYRSVLTNYILIWNNTCMLTVEISILLLFNLKMRWSFSSMFCTFNLTCKILAQIDGITRHVWNRAALTYTFLCLLHSPRWHWLLWWACLWHGHSNVGNVTSNSMKSKSVFPAVVSAVCGIVEGCEILPWVKAHDI